MGCEIGASSERGRSFVPNSNAASELTQKAFTRFEWFIPSQPSENIIITQPLIENKSRTIFQRFYYFIKHGHFIETQVSKERETITGMANAFRRCYTEVKENTITAASHNFALKDNSEYKVSLNKHDERYILTLEDVLGGDTIQKELSSQELDKFYLNILFGLGLLTNLPKSASEDHWNALLQNICLKSFSNNSEGTSIENNRDNQAKFHVEDKKLYKGERWQEQNTVILRESLFENRSFGWANRVNFKLANHEDPIDKILESSNKVMLIRMLSAKEVLTNYYPSPTINDHHSSNPEIEEWRNNLDIIDDESIQDNSKLKNNAAKIEQRKFVFSDIWKARNDMLQEEKQFSLEAFYIYNAVIEARQRNMSLITTCSQGKSRSTAVQLFNAIVRNNEDYFDKISMDDGGYIEPNIALLYRLLEHYVNDGNKLPEWLEGKPLNSFSLQGGVYRQSGSRTIRP